MDKLEPIRAVFRQCGLYNHAADDLLCERLAEAMTPKTCAGDLDRAIAAAREAAGMALFDDSPKAKHACVEALHDILAALDAAQPAVEFMGRRLTPEKTSECWGVLLCDFMQDPPKGTKLYAAPQAPPAAVPLPAPLPPTPDTVNLTDAQREVEDAFRRGWNSCRATVMQTTANKENNDG